MKNVAIITARGGSKRIPRKNIKDFLGKPIIAYSIEAALSAGCFDEVMVSTDDLEIAEVACKYGAAVPFMRSEKTSDDFATTSDVLTEVFETYRKREQGFEYACCIYPTAPFVTAKKLQDSYRILHENDADSAFPVVRFGYPILRALKVENERLQMIWPEYMNTRSQDLQPAYHDSGQFYWFNVERFMQTKRIFSEHTYSIEVLESEVQDIDTMEDWKIAEMKYTILFGDRFLNG